MKEPRRAPGPAQAIFAPHMTSFSIEDTLTLAEEGTTSLERQMHRLQAYFLMWSITLALMLIDDPAMLAFALS